MNCWEFKKCGREENGSRCKELGVCPAYSENRIDGLHNGKNAGRACWAVAGTLCGNKVQGGFGQKVIECMNCEFYKKVWKEEQGEGYKSPSEIIKLIKQ
jgi:hypothetical protein